MRDENESIRLNPQTAYVYASRGAIYRKPTNSLGAQFEPGLKL